MTVRILQGDCRELLRTLDARSVNTCVTSPPYFGLRDYGVEGQMGLEPTPDEFVAGMVAVFREVRRVLRDDGTLWLNIGDSYCASPPGRAGPGETSSLNGIGSQKYRDTLEAGHGGTRDKSKLAGLKQKDLIGIPWLLAFALRADGWYLRQDIIWSKPNPMPESVRDRCTKAHEYLFLLSKGPRYYFNAAAVAEPAAYPEGSGNKRDSSRYVVASTTDPTMRTKAGLADIGARETRNRRSVWEVATQPFSEAHFATYPPALIEPCILAGCPVGGTVLDPFFGAGTTGLVAQRRGRNCVGVELNPEYAAIAERRLRDDAGMFAEVLAA